MSDPRDTDDKRIDNGHEQLEQIERLLQEYRTTKDRRLLKRAIQLWDQNTAESSLLRSVVRVH
jgi:hypothetical protein